MNIPRGVPHFEEFQIFVLLFFIQAYSILHLVNLFEKVSFFEYNVISTAIQSRCNFTASLCT